MTRLAFACLILGTVAQSDSFEELQRLRQAVREKKALGAAAAWAAHEALDRGEYDVAVAEHRKSRALEAEAEKVRKEEQRILPGVVAALLQDLMHDDIVIRERATGRLILVGPAAVKPLERVLKSDDAEARGRAQEVLRRFRDVDVDEKGRVRQWATEAKASSEYTATSWSAKQAAGKPDTFQAADAPTAWASLDPDAGEEWLELAYAQAVRPFRVRIHETYNPGAVVRIEARDPEGKWRVLWKGDDPTREAPGWFAPTLEPPAFATREIRITIDAGRVPGWNEIDAVELVGDPAPPPKGK